MPSIISQGVLADLQSLAQFKQSGDKQAYINAQNDVLKKYGSTATFFSLLKQAQSEFATPVSQTQDTPAFSAPLPPENQGPTPSGPFTPGITMPLPSNEEGATVVGNPSGDDILDVAGQVLNSPLIDGIIRTPGISPDGQTLGQALNGMIRGQPSPEPQRGSVAAEEPTPMQNSPQSPPAAPQEPNLSLTPGPRKPDDAPTDHTLRLGRGYAFLVEEGLIDPGKTTFKEFVHVATNMDKLKNTDFSKTKEKPAETKETKKDSKKAHYDADGNFVFFDDQGNQQVVAHGPKEFFDSLPKEEQERVRRARGLMSSNSNESKNIVGGLIAGARGLMGL